MEINAFNAWFNSIRAQSFSPFHLLKASALSAVESTKKLLGRNSSKGSTDCISKTNLIEKKIQNLDNMSPYTEVTNSLLHTVHTQMIKTSIQTDTICSKLNHQEKEKTFFFFIFKLWSFAHEVKIGYAYKFRPIRFEKINEFIFWDLVVSAIK